MRQTWSCFIMRLAIGSAIGIVSSITGARYAAHETVSMWVADMPRLAKLSNGLHWQRRQLFSPKHSRCIPVMRTFFDARTDTRTRSPTSAPRSAYVPGSGVATNVPMLVYKPGPPYGGKSKRCDLAREKGQFSAAVFVAAMPAPSRYSGGLAVLSKTIDANPVRG
jgi:hypothetical protein